MAQYKILQLRNVFIMNILIVKREDTQCQTLLIVFSKMLVKKLYLRLTQQLIIATPEDSPICVCRYYLFQFLFLAQQLLFCRPLSLAACPIPLLWTFFYTSLKNKRRCVCVHSLRAKTPALPSPSHKGHFLATCSFLYTTSKLCC